MSMTDGFPVLVPGNHEPGPPTPDYYKRAVYRAAPSSFEVEVLAPTKIGGAFCYGLRIIPIRSSAASMRSRSSTVLTDYVIWRRWEDCLWFQDVLEQEYAIKSREKRQRLHAGKGVKKNGMYIHDHAASFESLPPGPDPKSVAKDVHDYLPKLSKKGTLFRPSQATIGQRHREFATLIHYFFKEDVPMLIRELREERVIRDFFGHWRRDHDIARKTKGKISTFPTNTFSTYFSASNISLSLPNHPDVPMSIPTSPLPPSNCSSVSSGATRHTRNSNESNSSLSLSDVDITVHQPRSPPASAPARTPGFQSREDQTHHVTNKASGSSLAVAHSPSTISTPSRPSKPRSPRDKPAFDMEEDFPLFLSSSTREGLPPSARPTPPPSRNNPPSSTSVGVGGLASLPEDAELGAPTLPDQLHPLAAAPTGRSRSNSATESAARATSMYFDSADLERPRTASDAHMQSRPASVALSTISFQLGSPPSRISWRSSRSSESSYGELDLPFTPAPIGGGDDYWFLAHDPVARPDSAALEEFMQPPAQAKQPRRSMSPPPLSPSSGAGTGTGVRRSSSSGSRRPRSQSQPMPAESEEDQFYASRPETPEQPLPQARRRQLSMTDHSRAFHLPSPPLTSPPPGHADGDTPTLVIKAAFNDAIVVFRVPRGVSLADVRARVYDKLVREEGLVLGGQFALAVVSAPAPASGRPRAGSVGTMSTVSSVGTVGRGREVKTESEWEDAVGGAGAGMKMVLRITEGE